MNKLKNTTTDKNSAHTALRVVLGLILSIASWSCWGVFIIALPMGNIFLAAGFGFLGYVGFRIANLTIESVEGNWDLFVLWGGQPMAVLCYLAVKFGEIGLIAGILGLMGTSAAAGMFAVVMRAYGIK